VLTATNFVRVLQTDQLTEYHSAEDVWIHQSGRGWQEYLHSNPRAICIRSQQVQRFPVCFLSCARWFSVSAHRFLEMYLQSGKEFMLNSTRIVFGLHSGGTIFPMHMGVKAMQPGFGALVLPISTEDGFIIFMKTTGSITACCAESLSVFGLPASALTNEAITVSRWVPNFAELAESPMAGAIAAQVDLINVSKVVSAARSGWP
jgi:hypothetical protein